jgi:hypothetical protein
MSFILDFDAGRTFTSTLLQDPFRQMAPGRKPLDADIKREHRRLSSAVYEAK